MKNKNHSISISIQGISLRLYSDNKDFIVYLNKHFYSTKQNESPCDIEVYMNWKEDVFKNIIPHEFNHLDKLKRIGRRIWIGDNELVWKDILKGLSLQFIYNGKTQIHAHYDMILSNFLIKRLYKQILRKESFERYKDDVYEGLTYFLVYYPILYVLENRNRYILHGSAVTYREKAILMPGLPGVGKSTLCMAMLSNENSKFVSDNIVLYDEDKVYPCFEPIRLDDNSISLMPDKGRKLVSMNIDSCYGRASYCVNENDTIQEMIPEILIIPCRADTGSLVEISYQDAAQLCMDFNRIAGETNSFLTYSSVQNMHFQKSGLDTSMLSTLHTLTKKLKCYMLSMEENTSIDKVLSMINEEIIDCS